MNRKGPIEAALSTDLRGEPYSFSLWDTHTGTQLINFKGNNANPIPKCVQLIDNHYFITVCDNIAQIWSLFNKKSQEPKLFLPGRPSTICVSPCGNYLVAGISEMIYAWQLKSGNLLAHTQRHYQTVSVLRMSSCGSFLVSGGEDGIVLVWSFADLVSGTSHLSSMNTSLTTQNVGVNEPRFTWQHHSGPVTDIHLTNGGLCVSVSTDMIVNLYCYSSGRRLLSVNINSPLWSVIMNKNETSIYVGSQQGDIYEIPVSSISISLLNAAEGTDDAAHKPTFIGHKGKVNCLALSVDGTRLISGSLDSSCKIWDIKHRKMLQSIKHQAALANLITFLVPESLALTSMSQAQPKLPLPVKPLKRNLYKAPRDGTVMTDDLFEEANTPIYYVKSSRDLWESTINISKNSSTEISEHVVEPNGFSTPTAETKNDELQTLKRKFKALYMLSAEKIFKDSAATYIKPFMLQEDVN